MLSNAWNAKYFGINLIAAFQEVSITLALYIVYFEPLVYPSAMQDFHFPQLSRTKA